MEGRKKMALSFTYLLATLPLFPGALRLLFVSLAASFPQAWISGLNLISYPFSYAHLTGLTFMSLLPPWQFQFYSPTLSRTMIRYSVLAEMIPLGIVLALPSTFHRGSMCQLAPHLGGSHREQMEAWLCCSLTACRTEMTLLQGSSVFHRQRI